MSKSNFWGGEFFGDSLNGNHENEEKPSGQNPYFDNATKLKKEFKEVMSCIGLTFKFEFVARETPHVEKPQDPNNKTLHKTHLVGHKGDKNTPSYMGGE